MAMISTYCPHFNGLRRSSPKLDSSQSQSFLQHINSQLRLASSRKPCRAVTAMAGSGKFFVGGNWKCNGTKDSITKLVSDLNSAKLETDVDVVVSPPFVYLDQVTASLTGRIEVSAQNSWIGKGGAFTGEISVEQLKDIGCKWVILGHSERRHIIGEDDQFIGKKAAYALNEGLGVIACIGVGYAMMIAPVYTAEVAPATSRGFLSSFPEIFINIGILLGYVSNYFFSKLPVHLGWRFMLGVGSIPSVCLAIGVLAMPESPRWLVLQGRLGDAFKVLDKTSNTKEEAISRLNDIKRAAGIPEDMTDDVIVVPNRKSAGKGVWKDLLVRPTPAVRHILIACLGIHFSQQASGIDAVVLYSPSIFQKAGLKSKNDQLLATVAVGVVKTLFIVVGTCVVDRFGRRALLLTSMGGMFLSLTALGTSLTVIDRNPGQTLKWAIGLSVTTVMTFVATFSIGAGPVTWVYCSEIFPVRLRAQGASLGVMLNRLMSGIIGMTFLSLSKGLTIGGAFLLFAGVAAAAWVFFFTFLPETRGMPLEEMESLFGSYTANKKKNVTEEGTEVVEEH